MRGKKATLIDELARALGDGADLERLMETHKASAIRMLELMETPHGTKLREARKKLGKIQRELLAYRFSGFAVNKLIAVLQGDKPDLCLRAATQILDIAEGNARGSEGAPSKQEQRVFEIEQAEAGRFMELLALGVKAKREAAEKEAEEAGNSDGAV
jgi:hypothetical protein